MKKSMMVCLFIAVALSAFAFKGLDFSDRETVTVTGTIYAENRIHAELNSGEQEYLLMIPRFLLDEIEDGAEVSVEGYKLEEGDEMPRRIAEEDYEKYIFVSKLTINGEVIDVEEKMEEHREERQNERGQGRGGRGGRHRGGPGGKGGYEDCPMR